MDNVSDKSPNRGMVSKWYARVPIEEITDFLEKKLQAESGDEQLDDYIMAMFDTLALINHRLDEILRNN